MSVRDFCIVFGKELRDALRDRRSLLAGLLFALLGPVVLTAALHALIKAERGGDKQPLYVTGGTLAPGLMAHLSASGLILAPGEEGAESLLARDPDAVVLAIPARAPRDLAGGATARVELWADLARSGTRRRVEHIERTIGSYALQLEEQRLLAAGMPLVAPLSVELRDTAAMGDKAALVLGMLPVFWLLGVFVGGSHVALDSMGGERERRSLEVLLAQPLTPLALFTGKWLVTSLFGFIAATAGMLLSAFALTRLPLYELGISWAPDAALLASAVVVLLPLALLVGALQCFVTLAARSHREAQTYISVLQLVPMILVVERTATVPWVPLLGQHQQLSALLAGQPPAWPFQAAAMAASVVTACALAWAASRKLDSERFVFGL